MTIRSQHFASEITRSLRNENVVVITDTTPLITIANAKTGELIYRVTADCVEQYGLTNVVFTIKQETNYPAPKVRKPKMTVKTHGAPKYVGISMGAFKPEANLSF